MFDAESFLELKGNFENRLRDLISQEVEDFRKNTGFSPSAIRCRLTEITALEDRGRQYMVSNIETQFELFGDHVLIK